MNSIREATETIANQDVIDLVTECVNVLSNNGYDVSMDEIDLKFSSSTRHLGEMEIRPPQGDKYTLTLSKYMVDDNVDNIKNTIYHELCHLIQFKYLIDHGYISPRGEDWYFNSWVSRDKQNWGKQHGGLWKSIAEKVGNLTGLDLQRTGSSQGLDNARQENYKHIVRCPDCGNEVKTMRATPFTKEPNITQWDYYLKYDKDGEGIISWIERNHPDRIDSIKSTHSWKCGNCGQHGRWEIIK